MTALPAYFSNTATTYQNATTDYAFSGAAGDPVKIPGSFLTATNKFLIGYTASYGMSTVSAVGELFLTINQGDAFAHSLGEGFTSPANPYEPMRTQALCGWYLHTGDATDLELAYRSTAGGGAQIDVHGAALLAIDISTLTENVDYFQSQLNQTGGSETGVGTWTSVDSIIDVHTANFTLPSGGDFIVLASMEGSASGSGPLDGTLMQLDINGALGKWIPEGETDGEFVMEKEMEDASDIHSFSYAEIHTLSAGSNTFTLQGGSMKGTNDKLYWRPRIFLFRVDSFAQVATINTTGSSVHTQNVTSGNYQTILSKSYTPGQSGNVVQIGNGMTRREGQGSGAHRMYNNTTPAVSSPYVANAIQDTTGVEQCAITNLGMESISTAQTYQLQSTSSDGANTYTTEPTMILWDMELASAPSGGPYFLSHEDTSLTMTDAVYRTLPITFEDSALTMGTEETSLGTGVAHFTFEDAALGMSDLTSLTIEATGVLPHPRLISAARLVQLKDLAGSDGTGVGAGTAFWQDLKNYVDVSSKPEPQHYAIAYAITGTVSYAQTAWSKLESDINGGPAWLSSLNNNFLYYRDAMRDAAYVFDLCYDWLTQASKDRIVNWMNMLTFIVWMRTSDANAIWDTGDWADRNPNQNYFSNYMLGTIYQYLATEGENDGTFVDEWGQGTNTPGRAYTMTLYFNGLDPASGTYTNTWDYWNAKLTMAWSEWDVRCEGGGWNEGANYGRAALRHQAEMFLTLKEIKGIDYMLDPNHTHIRETVNWWLRFAQPRTGMLYHDGDAAATAALYVNAYDRHLMLLLGRGLEGTPESEYARWWCENGSHQQMSGISDMRPVDFLEDDPTLPTTDYRNILSTQAHFPGVDFWTSRPSWDDDAVCVSMRSTDPIVGHNHMDQNGIQIYRGGGASVDGWQITDRGVFSSGVPNSTADHNCINVNNYEQRKEPFWPLGSPKQGYDLAGDITRYEFGTDYSYGRGDASDAYWQGKKMSTSHGTDKMTTVCHRELFHVFDEYVFVYDRVTLINAIYNPVDINWHYPYVQPTDLGGGVWRSTNDVGRAYQHVILPSTRTMTWIDEDTFRDPGDRDDTWRMTVEPSPSSGTEFEFLNVFQITAATNNSPTTITALSSAGGEMTGCQIKDSTEHKIILVSTAPTGASPSAAFSYTFDLDGSTHKHYLANLTPGTWGVTFVDNGTTGVVTVDPAGTGSTVSSEGVLIVSTFAAAPDVVIAFEDSALTLSEENIHLNPHRKYTEPALTLGPIETTLQVDTGIAVHTFNFEDLSLALSESGLSVDVPNHSRYTEPALTLGPIETALNVESTFDFEDTPLMLSETVLLDIPNHPRFEDSALTMGPSAAELTVDTTATAIDLAFEDRLLVLSDTGGAVSTADHDRRLLSVSGTFDISFTTTGTIDTEIN